MQVEVGVAVTAPGRPDGAAASAHSSASRCAAVPAVVERQFGAQPGGVGEQLPHGDAVSAASGIGQVRPGPRASRPSVPRSICCTAATAVKSLVREARSKTVSTRIGTHALAGQLDAAVPARGRRPR